MAPSSEGGWDTGHTVALGAVPLAMLLVDSDGNAVAVNRRWLELSGLEVESSLGSGWLSSLDAEAARRILEDTRAAIDRDCVMQADFQLGTGSPGLWTRWYVGRHDRDHATLAAIAVADVDDDHTREEGLYHLATHDALTGLLNRSYFLDCVDQALRRKERHATRVGVVFVDLDGFKRVNDLGGHALGDRVLLAVGARLRHCLRSADQVARIGGDEFAVLCEDLSDAGQAEYVTGRIAAALSESVEIDGHAWAIAASVGSAVDIGAHDDAEALLDRADRAMYRIKAGRTGTQEPGAQPIPITAHSPLPFPDRRASRRPEQSAPSERPLVVERPSVAEHPLVVERMAQEVPRLVVAAPAADADDTEPEERTEPALTRDEFLADMQALRDSLDAMRTSLGRFERPERPVVDVRENIRNQV
jgi:diguanylate cyclase (GGDEF)-like protein